METLTTPELPPAFLMEASIHQAKWMEDKSSLNAQMVTATCLGQTCGVSPGCLFFAHLRVTLF